MRLRLRNLSTGAVVFSFAALALSGGILNEIRPLLPGVKAMEAASAPSARIAAGNTHSLAIAGDGTVWAWGANERGQLGDGTTVARQSPVPVTGLTGVVAVAAGGWSSFALREDGTLWAWGFNERGSLGDGTTLDRSTPVQVVGLSNITAVAAGLYHALALDENGTVWSWGENGSGQLGDGTWDNRSLPAPVGGLTQAKGIAAGGSHSLAFLEDGTLWAWGANGLGQLGVRTRVRSKTPVLVDSIDNVVGVEAGMFHSLALDGDGAVWSWGWNATGQLGDGTFRTRRTPVRVRGLPFVSGIAAGGYHNFALEPNGTVWAWGLNLFGELGDGTSALRRNIPVRLSSLENIVALAGGGAHSLALTSDEDLFGWGYNGSGQVGDGTRRMRRSPVPVHLPVSDQTATPTFDPPGASFSSPVSVTLGCATPGAVIHYTTNGLEPTESDPAVSSGETVLVDRNLTLKAKAWASGLLPSAVASESYSFTVATPVLTPGGGLYDTPQEVSVSSSTPESVVYYTIDGSDPAPGSFLYTAPIPIETGTVLTLRAFRDGWTPSDPVAATYSFDYGTLAEPTLSPNGGRFTTSVDVELEAPLGEIRFTTDGSDPTPASSLYLAPITLMSTTTLKAAAFAVDWTPSPPASAEFVIQAATPTFEPDGGFYTLEPTVTLWCDTPGALIHYTTDGVDPAEADPFVASGESIHVGESVTLKARAFAPGTDPSEIAETSYELGVATPTMRPRGGVYGMPPTVVLGSATTGAEIHFTTDGSDPGAGSPLYTVPLRITDSRTLKARAFRAGFADSEIRIETYVIGAGGLAAGEHHSLALRPDGSVWSWGANDSGQLGVDDGEGRSTPGPVPGLDGVLVLAAGARHALALRYDGTVWAFGANESGQLGDGSETSRYLPAPVVGLGNIVAIAAGGSHSLALAADGTVWAWGENAAGQLGDGSTTSSSVPIQVDAVRDGIAIAAGSSHSLALEGDGTLWAWGDNEWGQLGDGINDSSSVPVRVELENVDAIAAGGAHSLAVTKDGSVWAWGDNSSGQLGGGEYAGPSSSTPVEVQLVVECEECSPGPFEDATAVAAGRAHSLALRSDGTVWAWGEGSSGQIGDGELQSRPSPVQVSLPDVVIVIASAGNHNLALGADGTVWAWGANEDGEIGDGTFENRSTPVKISEAGLGWKTATPVLSVPSGAYSMEQSVLVTDATPGAAIHYRLDGAEPTESDPVVPSGATIVVDRSLMLRARAFHSTLAPSNVASADYQLIVAAPVLSPPPGSYDAPVTVTISDPTPGATLHYTTNGLEPTESDPEISSGDSLFIDVDLFVWVKGFREGWQPAATSGLYRMAVLTPVFDPGPGTYEEMQEVTITVATPGAVVHYTTDGSYPSIDSPVAKPGVPVPVDRSLTLRALGFRDDLEPSDLASGTYTLRVKTPVLTPSEATGVGPVLVTVSTQTPGAAIRYTLNGGFPDGSSPLYTSPIFIDSSKTLRARAFKFDWTASGLAESHYDIVPADVATPRLTPPPGTYTTAQDVIVTCDTQDAAIHVTTNGLEPTESDPEIASGAHLSVDRDTVLKVKAWRDGAGESSVFGGTYLVTGAVSAGGNFTLALKADGTVWGWGANGSGQLGNGSMDARVTTPVAVLLPVPVVAIDAGGSHALAIDREGAVWAWGRNNNGQLGDGTTESKSTPVKVIGPSGIVAIAAGGAHSLALSGDRKLWAWGANSLGRLGDGTTIDRHSPVRVTSLDFSGITAVAAGGAHSLALGRGGALYAWGVNFDGQLGIPQDSSSHPNPFRVNVPPLAAVSGGSFHSIGLETDGAVAGRRGYWGGSPTFEGDPDDITMLSAGGANVAVTVDGSAWTSLVGPPRTLKRVLDLHDVVGVSAGQSHFAAVSADGRIWTWGSNAYGELGDGTLDPSSEPAPVADLRLVENASAEDDPDGDWLSDAEESRWGTDPRNPDTNGDGIPDGLEVALGLSPTNPDMDADGVVNAVELGQGTDPFDPDTDGDGFLDGVDCFPLDASQNQCLAEDPDDHTPPVITILTPTGLRLVSSNP